MSSVSEQLAESLISLACIHCFFYNMNHKPCCCREGKQTGIYIVLSYLIFSAQSTLSHASFTQVLFNLKFTHSYSNGCIKGSSEISILPKHTSTCRLEEPGIKPATFWLVNDPLHLLSHSHPKLYTPSTTNQGRLCLEIGRFRVVWL